jgi:hypothetical protein
MRQRRRKTKEESEDRFEGNWCFICRKTGKPRTSKQTTNYTCASKGDSNDSLIHLGKSTKGMIAKGKTIT